MMQDNSKPNANRIGLMGLPLPNPNARFGTGSMKVVDLLAPQVERLFIISGNVKIKPPYDNVTVVNAKVPIVKSLDESIWSKFFRLLVSQFTLSWKLIQLSRKLDIVIIFLGAELLFLPCLVTRLLGKKLILIIIGSGAKSLKAMYPGILGRSFATIVQVILHLNCFLANRVVIYSKSMVFHVGLQNHHSKISIAQQHFLDLGKFKVQKPLSERQNLVGYIGRLSQEKGILNLIEAVPQVLEVRDDIDFLIGGDGQLRSEIEDYLTRGELTGKVKLIGWIPHDKLPNYLNELKLLVLPSYTEGGAFITLEAMACGTSVLATPVGSIPDVIKDSETGFIMEDNSPETIARNIIRALNHPNLEKLTRNARALMEKEFTYESLLEKYRNILSGVTRCKKKDDKTLA